MRSILLPLFLIVSGCASLPDAFETPNFLIGEVKYPQFTGWYRDYCSTGRPVREIYAIDGCLSHGGELYKATLYRARMLNGERINATITIAYPAHALPRHYKQEMDVFLQRTPDDFREASGIEYIATDYGLLNELNNCARERGIGHTDHSRCKDSDFHEIHANKCVPIAQFVEHYSEAGYNPGDEGNVVNPEPPVDPLNPR